MELIFLVFSKALQYATVSHVAKKAQGLQNLSYVTPKIPFVFLTNFGSF
jgi:hypothetical protein